MSRRCELTGVGPLTGNQVSHSNTKTRTRWLPNIKDKRYFVPELGQVLRLRLTTRAIRTIDKQGGISRAIQLATLENLSPRLAKIRAHLAKASGALTDHPAARKRNHQAKEIS
jgi:large subunit ribosomal protein L28